MKQKIIEILSVKMRATVDEDHEPFVYGHEEAAHLIMQYFCDKAVAPLTDRFETNEEIYERLEPEGYPEEMITKSLIEYKRI